MDAGFKPQNIQTARTTTTGRGIILDEMQHTSTTRWLETTLAGSLSIGVAQSSLRRAFNPIFYGEMPITENEKRGVQFHLEMWKGAKSETLHVDILYARPAEGFRGKIKISSSGYDEKDFKRALPLLTELISDVAGVLRIELERKQAANSRIARLSEAVRTSQ